MNYELKTRAKEQLGGAIFGRKWLIAVLVMIITAAVSGIAARIHPVASLLVLGPVMYSVAFLFLKQSRDNEEMNLNDLIKGFTDDFSGNLLLGLMRNLFITLWSLLFVIPGIIKTYSYSMAFYIKADNPDYDWRTCLDASTAMMNGHKMELFMLDLSFLGWLILGALCAGVGSFWVAAWMQAAHAQFYNNLLSGVSVEF